MIDGSFRVMWECKGRASTHCIPNIPQAKSSLGDISNDTGDTRHRGKCQWGTVRGHWIPTTVPHWISATVILRVRIPIILVSLRLKFETQWYGGVAGWTDARGPKESLKGFQSVEQHFEVDCVVSKAHLCVVLNEGKQGDRWACENKL